MPVMVTDGTAIDDEDLWLDERIELDTALDKINDELETKLEELTAGKTKVAGTIKLGIPGELRERVLVV